MSGLNAKGLFDLVPEILFEATIEGDLLALNTYGCERLGLQNRALHGRFMEESVGPQGRWAAIMRQIQERGWAQDLELAWVYGDGRTRSMFLSAALAIRSDGKTRYLTGLLRDMSDANRLEAKILASRNQLRTIVDAIPELIVGVDFNHRVVLANRAVGRWIGRHITEVIGLECKEIHLGYEAPCLTGSEKGQCPVDLAFEVGEAFDKEMQLVNYRGERRWFEQVAFPVLDGQGEAYQVALLMRDITEKKQAKEQIMQLNQDLKEALDSLEGKNVTLREALENLQETQAHLFQSGKMASIGQLAAGVAHEINNPVGFVSSNLRTLLTYGRDLKALLVLYRALEEEAGQCPGRTSRCVDLAVRLAKERDEADLDFILGDLEELICQSMEGTDRVQKIVADLKEFSHVDQADLKEVNINQGLESTINVVSNELKYKAAVHKDFGELPLLLCYPQQINQVFMNLLINAGQAIEGRGEIAITTRRVEMPRPGVEVHVRDTGCGIPNEILSKIFDPFFTSKEVGEGQGLGLHIAYKIVQRHQGEIRVESEVGKGSCFQVFLPLLSGRAFLASQEENAETEGQSADTKFS